MFKYARRISLVLAITALISTHITNPIQVHSPIKAGVFGALTLVGLAGLTGCSIALAKFDREGAQKEANKLWADLTAKGARIWKDSTEGSAYNWSEGKMTTTTQTSWKIEFPKGNFSAEELDLMESQWNRFKSIKNDDAMKGLITLGSFR